MIFEDYLLSRLFYLKSVISGQATISFSVLVPFQLGSCFKGENMVLLVQILSLIIYRSVEGICRPRRQISS